MFKVLKHWWYWPFTTDLPTIGIVKTENDGEIQYHIGTADGSNLAENINMIVTYGSYFNPEELIKGEK
ncbi:hypothetical protein [Peptoniphilus sp.]|uniref:hypothetical protein n=1 Tax=Peptoniphilus sp. TaxID=1971214 RepID=UPI003D8B1CB1